MVSPSFPAHTFIIKKKESEGPKKKVFKLLFEKILYPKILAIYDYENFRIKNFVIINARPCLTQNFGELKEFIKCRLTNTLILECRRYLAFN